MLKENERIDDLECKGYKIIQNIMGFCYGMDSVLLADFAKELKKGSKVVDLGTGTGIIGILLCAKTELEKIIGIEVQQEVYDMATRSIELNQLQNRFELIHKNIKEIKEILPEGKMDVVVSNPPYKKLQTGIQNENEKKLISRHEVLATLEDFIKAANYVLKDKGFFYMVHRPDRLVDIIELLRKYKLEPKTLKLVYPYIGKQPNLVLIKAIKNANPFLKIEKPLYVYEEDETYTKDILKIYGKEQ